MNTSNVSPLQDQEQMIFLSKQTKEYPASPQGCKSLEEFSDKLEEAILKKL